ncbi:hypothetical protein NQ317_019705 [Molorchus minor]|uniref:THAP-type domain-containing protein n=1 Tax=Molorchus minor TaxID=1323400 RepID=A0ABQ9JR29_9CUCU|nr:hypothetical protein NQ317_019705 [Molorchus minor]
MPSFCCVDKLKFFRIPAVLNFKHKHNLNELSARRRLKWLNAIKRADFPEHKQKDAVVCSRHFISGQPADLTDELNPDWVPSQYGYNKQISSGSRMERFKRKRKKMVKPEVIGQCIYNITNIYVMFLNRYMMIKKPFYSQHQPSLREVISAETDEVPPITLKWYKLM